MKNLLFLFSLTMSIGTYMMVPLLVLHFKYGIQLTYLDITICLALKLISQRLGYILNLYIAHKFNAFHLIITGVLLGVIALLLLLNADSMQDASIAMILFGLSASIYLPSTKSLLLSFSKASRIPRVLGQYVAVRNVGVGLGAFVGSLIITFNYYSVISSAIVMYLFGLSIVILINIFSVSTTPKKNVPHFKIIENLKAIPVERFLPCFVFGLAYSQLEYAFPLHVELNFGQAWISYFFILNTFLIICCQSLISNFVIRRLTNFRTNMISLLLMCLMLLLPIYNSIIMCVLAITFFTIAEIIILISIDVQVYQLANSKPLSIEFSINEIIIGLGVMSGYVVSGICHQYFANAFVFNNLLVLFIFTVGIFQLIKKS